MQKTFECPFLEEESHRYVLRIVMVSIFLVVSFIWIGLSLPKEAETGTKLMLSTPEHPKNPLKACSHVTDPFGNPKSCKRAL